MLNTIKINARRMSRMCAFGLAIGAGLMVTAAPAHASPGTISVHVGFSNITHRIEHANRSPVVRHVSREFERGVEAGRHDGYEAGFHAGLRGERFCDAVTLVSQRGSTQFREGYRVGYASAYRAGFDRGVHERHSHRRIWR